jgi:putative ABC transport system permease protein
MNWTFWRRKQRNEELDEELRGHLTLETREEMEAGRSRKEAEFAARRQLGNEALIGETTRDMWGWKWLEDFVQDVRYGARTLRKNPGFTAVAVLTLALGIGANTAMFSVVDAVMLKPLPFSRPEQLVTLWRVLERNPSGRYTPSYPDFRDWKAESHSFSSVAAFMGAGFTLTGVGEAANLNGAMVSHDLFEVLGAAPELGPGFSLEDDRSGARSGTDAVVLSHKLWQGNFGGDPKIIGRLITLDNKPFTIVGVMPPGFQFPIQVDPVDLWTTIAPMAAVRAPGVPPPTEQRTWHGWNAIARLSPGISLALAQDEMTRIQSARAQKSSNKGEARAVRVVRLKDLIGGDSRTSLLILLATVGCVLLIACTNVANLLLARAVPREREIGVRVALGAGLGRITRQLLTENVLLYSIGAGAGVLFAKVGLALLLAVKPPDIPRLAEAHIDGTVLGFALAIALATAILFGLFPALQIVKGGMRSSLAERDRASTGSVHHNRLKSAMIVVEVALALVLLTSSGLLMRSLSKLEAVKPGFNPNHVLTFMLTLVGPRYSGPQGAQFFSTLTERLASVPGVNAASGIAARPFGGGMNTTFLLRGQAAASGNDQGCDLFGIEPDYFRAMEIPLISGRFFTKQDAGTTARVAIVSQSLARRYFGDADPIGQQIQPLASTESGPPPMRTIVGVVADVKAENLRQENIMQVYMPYPQFATGAMTIVARTTSDPKNTINDARSLLHSMDPNVPFDRPTTLDDEIYTSLTDPRYDTVLLGLFAGLAMILTLVGLYGVISYTVAQRTQEIGIRMALGAQTGDVMKLVMRHAAFLVLAGTALGIAGALALTRFLSSLLYQVKPVDPATYLAVSILLTVVALVASYLPARRAMRVDPIVALRHE